MCPSYRATGDEQHLTRGRADTLRLALSGQLGPEAFASDDMRATLDLCISCKGCRRECPTGVDMARMKIEFLYHYRQRHGLSPRDRLIAFLPRWAPYGAPLAPLLNLRNRLPFLAQLGERWLGLSAERPLPRWSRRPYRARAERESDAGGGEQRREVVLLADTFNRYFEPENLRATERVLTRAGYRVVSADPAHGRPLCCGRTFLTAGLVEEARAEARRMLAALAPFIESGAAIVGLEPSCLLTLRDEFPAMLPDAKTTALAGRAQLFEEFVAAEREAGRFELPLKPMPDRKVLLHGHCHQKAFATVGAALDTLRLIPGTRGRDVPIDMLRGWLAASAMRPSITRYRSRSASFRYCRRCARPRPRRCWPPAAPAAATRSPTPPAAKPATSSISSTPPRLEKGGPRRCRLDGAMICG